MTTKPKKLLQQLVQIPSVNPAFGSKAELDLTGEARMTRFLQQFCEAQQWDWARQQVSPGRENLVTVVPGHFGQPLVFGKPGPGDEPSVVLWDVHQDTVGVDGMRISPFGGEESEGRIWGRGACDVKGAMAAMLSALTRLKAGAVAAKPASDSRPAGDSGPASDSRPTILLSCTVNEENGFSGIRALCNVWESPDEEPGLVAGTLSAERLRSLRPQAALVAEPTSLNVVVAHKGVARWRCHVTGRAAHSSRPECGENAIVAMAEVVRAIDQFHQQTLTHREPHPLCGGPTVCVSTIAGGTGVNTVPDHAVIDIDRRLVPGESPAMAYRELVDYVAERACVGECQITHDEPWLVSDSLADDQNSRLAEQVASAVRSMDQPCELMGAAFGTNAAVVSQLGIPTVVFGPGSIEQAHTEDEWIEIDQLDRAAEVYYRLATAAQNTSSTK